MATTSLVAAIWLGANHPLWPVSALSLQLLCVAAVAWRPGLWLFLIPAGLPWLNFSPWTGWIVVEEFDLLLLATFAGAYGGLAFCKRYHGVTEQQPAPVRRPGPFDVAASVLALALLLSSLFGLLPSLRAHGGISIGWFSGYADPLNGLRVFKSVLFAVLTMPLLRTEMRLAAGAACARFALGMVVGLAVVAMAALWERAAYPGILDFSTVYRVVALFWEMHVGGGAIDAYLAMAMPFVLWAVLSARGWRDRAASAVLAVVASYACLTTFSRGVYVAVAASLVLGSLLHRRRTTLSPGIEPLGAAQASPVGRSGLGPAWYLAFAIAVLAAVVLVGGTLGVNRWTMSDRDFDSRLARWRAAVKLLDRPADLLAGLGIGRFPAIYAGGAGYRHPGELAGRVQLQSDGAMNGGVFATTIHGPSNDPDLGGLFALTQRVSAVGNAPLRASLDFVSARATVAAIQVCNRHLLYDWDCKGALVPVSGLPGTVQHWSGELSGDMLGSGPWYAPRLHMFAISVLEPGTSIDIHHVGLRGSDGTDLLSNGDFSRKLAQWLPAAQYFFLPWHIDSLYIELLVERGLIGLVIFIALVGMALARLIPAVSEQGAIQPFVAASIASVLLVGSVSSILDVPRVAYLLYLLIFLALAMPMAGRDRAAIARGARKP